jgi:hypothetical protein
LSLALVGSDPAVEKPGDIGGDDKNDDRGHASGRQLVTTIEESLASTRIAPYRTAPFICAPLDAGALRDERL